MKPGGYWKSYRKIVGQTFEFYFHLEESRTTLPVSYHSTLQDTKVSGNPHQGGGREEFMLHDFAGWTSFAIPKASSFIVMPPGIF